MEEADVFAIHQEGGRTLNSGVFLPHRPELGNRAYFPKADALEGREVLGSFLSPSSTTTSRRPRHSSRAIEEAELLAEALAQAGRKVSVSVPVRGEKKDQTDPYPQNAREALGRRLARPPTRARLLEGSRRPSVWRKLDSHRVYDNSHIMGTNAVGAMIVAGRGRFRGARDGIELV